MEQDPGGVRRVRLATGVSLSYASSGLDSATPVLLLHAWAESRRSFDRLVRLLPASAHAIGIDQRGHGDADRPAVGYSLDNLAEDVEAFMDAVGISSAVLLGSSSGGYVAQQVAIRSPNRVAGLVLVGSPRTLQGRPSFADEIERLTDPIDIAWVRKSLTWFPRFHRVPQEYIDDRVRDGVRIPAHVWREAFNGLIAARPPTEAATITAPTLIIWGDHDELLTRDDEERLAAAIPGSRLVVYEDTGHLVLWEQPERLASDLTCFIEGLNGRPD
jgi:pimeloyl-ACP methyl ester carboxylesterase